MPAPRPVIVPPAPSVQVHIDNDRLRHVAEYGLHDAGLRDDVGRRGIESPRLEIGPRLVRQALHDFQLQGALAHAPALKTQVRTRPFDARRRCALRKRCAEQHARREVPIRVRG